MVRQVRVVEPAAVSGIRLRADARAAVRDGADAIRRRQLVRLRSVFAFARERSSYYRELYRGLPDSIGDVALLPPTNKTDLMARFDDVVTDPRVARAAVDRFAADASLIGTPFLDDYTVATTSGTTGTRGLFLLDRGTVRVASAMTGRMLSEWLTARDVSRIVAGRGRIAIVSASGGHFASAAAAARLRRTPVGRRLVQLFPVSTPLPELVADLNAMLPSVLAPYATTALLLAAEQEAGRLHIHPALVVLAAEGVPEGEYERIGRAFNARVGGSYAATECPFLSYRCSAGWMHVNSDWVLVEPVQADGSRTPAGEPSHSVLITNFANRVQPILRYDLGDSVLVRPDRCECGSPLPAVRVQGRTSDLLRFPAAAADRQVVLLSPLTLAALLDRIPGLLVGQIVQVEPSVVRVALLTERGVDSDQVWNRVSGELRALFQRHGLVVDLQRSAEPPRPSAGGKYRTVQPLAPD